MPERNTFLVLSLLAALSCSEDTAAPEPNDTTPITDLSTGALCPDGSTLTYDSFGKDFMGTYCTRCHTSTATGDARLAPLGANFDQLPTIRMLAHQIDRAAAAGPNGMHLAMPPSEPYPGLEQRQKLGHWLACGAPSGGSNTTYGLREAAGAAASP